MNLQSVKSGNIARVGHDRATKKLQIEFQSGALYEFSDVTKRGHTRFIEAESIGAYFHAFIKGQFQSKKLRGKKGEKDVG